MMAQPEENEKDEKQEEEEEEDEKNEKEVLTPVSNYHTLENNENAKYIVSDKAKLGTTDVQTF